MAEVKTRLYLANVDGLTEEGLLAKSVKTLSSEGQQKIARLKTKAARARSAGAQVLLQIAIRETFGISQPLRLAKGDCGKPLLADYPQIQFNLSHSGHYAVCALGNNPVGVDLQIIKESKLKLARRFFSEAEISWLESLPQEKQVRGFYDLWAIKESYMKYTGLGFRLPLNAFTVKLSGCYPEEMKISIIRNNDEQKIFLKAYDGPENFVLWCCSQDNHFEETIRFVDLEEQCGE